MPDNPTKLGYNFGGWYSDSELTNSYSFSQMPAQNITLFAKWTVNQYTITFESNGGSAVSSITDNYNSTVSQPSDPTRAGYTFDGWYSDNNLTNSYTFNTMAAQNITLYAKWTVNQYTITFESNSGTVVSSITDNYNSTVTQPSNPTRDGYTFDGWYSDIDLNNPYTFNTMPAQNITLYAKWTVNQYTITFESNSGTVVSSITDNYNSTVTQPSNPTRAGYTFDGWYSDIDLNNAYTFNTMPAQNITLYAKWTVNPYTITFESNSGTVVSSITDNYNSTVTQPSNPTRAGYTFDGWYSDINLNNPYTFNTMPAQNITLYAKWTVNQYTITFESNSGTVVSSITDNYNSTVAQPSNPTRTCYTFGGWYSDNNLVNPYTFNKMPAQNITLYAKWTVNQYTITFESNSGTVVTSITDNYNSTVTVPSNPTRTGYTFEGWYSDIELNNAYTFNTIPAQNITLYAKWNFVPSEDLEYQISIGGNYYSITGYCGSDSVIYIPNFYNNLPVLIIDNGAFEYLDIASIIFEDNSQLTTISDDAFYSSSLTDITIPASVTKIGKYAFEDSNLETINFEEGSHLILIDMYAFRNTYITNITIPNSVKTIGEEAFYDTLLTNITIPSSVTSIGSTPFDASSILSINVDENNPIYKSVNGVLFNKNLTILIEFPAGVTGTYIVPNTVNEISEYAFYISQLTSVIIPNSVNTIREGAFEESELSELRFTGMTPPIYEDYAFDSYENVTAYVQYDALDIYQSTYDGLFYSIEPFFNVTFNTNGGNTIDPIIVDNNKQLTIPSDPIKSLYRFAGWYTDSDLTIAFDFDTLITDYITLYAKWSYISSDGLEYQLSDDHTYYIISGYSGTDTVIYISSYYDNLPILEIGDSAFYDTSITSIIFENTSQLNTIGDSAFYGSTLTNITLPSSVTVIDNEAFSNSTLQTITFEPDSQLSAIGNYAFFNTLLTNIFIPTTVTLIGDYAFAESALTDITIPNNVTVIGDYAFSNSQLRTIKFLSTTPPICTNTIFTGLSNISIYALMASIDIYKTALSDYASSINPLYTITFENNGGSITDSNIVEENGTATIPITPTKDGYTFNKWYLDSGLTLEFDFSTPITNDLTLYAEWTINQYTVTFDTHGGSDIDTLTVNYQTIIAIPLDPTRDYYQFDGWYTDRDYSIEYDFSLPIRLNTTIYAKWSIIATNDLSYTLSSDGESYIISKYTGSATVICIPSYYDGLPVSAIANFAFISLPIESVLFDDNSQVTTIGDFTFINTLISSVTIPSSVSSIGIMSFNNSNLMNINVDDNNPYYLSDNGIVFSKDLSTLIMFPLGRTGTYTVPNTVRTIYIWAFGNSNLTSILFEDNSQLTLIDSFAFNTSLITTITLPSSVTTIGDDAFGYSQLESISYEDNSQLKTLGEYVFEFTPLTTINIPSSVISIGDFTFYDTPNLRSITVDETNYYFTSENGVLFNDGFSNLVKCPEAITGSYIVPESVLTIGTYAFSHSQLTSITLPENLTEIMDFAFEYSQIISITIPSSTTSIDWRAFSHSEIQEISFENGSELQYIGQYSFEYTQLTSITIPSSVIQITGGAFSNTELTTVTFNGTTPPHCYVLFDDITDITIYVPFTSLDLYKTTFSAYETAIKPFYTVTFDTNGGITINSLTLYSIAPISETIIPTKDGYLFSGWYTDTDLTTEFDFITPITSDLILYAAWN